MKFLILSLFLAFVSGDLFAEQIHIIIEQKQEKKKQSRWSLGEWMIQQRKIRLMDQWLALNTNEVGSEWKLSYDNASYDRDDSGADKNATGLGLELFYGFLGVGYEVLSSEGDTVLKNSSLKIKLLGSSQQSTHFNAVYGISSGSGSTDPKASFYGYEGDLYLFNNFGYHFEYHEHKADSKSASVHFDAFYRENGIFVESGFIRLNYTMYELDYRESATPFKDKGIKFGVELNF